MHCSNSNELLCACSIMLRGKFDNLESGIDSPGVMTEAVSNIARDTNQELVAIKSSIMPKLKS